MNNGDGGLIRIHYHDNKEVLDFLSDNDDNLYYKNKPIFIQVSSNEANAIQILNDGIFVNNTFFLTENQYNMLTKFVYKNNVLYYNDIIVSQEYSDTQIENMVKDLWDELEPKDETKEQQQEEDDNS